MVTESALVKLPTHLWSLISVPMLNRNMVFTSTSVQIAELLRCWLWPWWRLNHRKRFKNTQSAADRLYMASYRFWRLGRCERTRKRLNFWLITKVFLFCKGLKWTFGIGQMFIFCTIIKTYSLKIIQIFWIFILHFVCQRWHEPMMKSRDLSNLFKWQNLPLVDEYILFLPH